MTYQVYKDSKEKYRWRLKADNNETIAISSEGYESKQSCLHSIDLTKGSKDAKIDDQTKK